MQKVVRLGVAVCDIGGLLSKLKEASFAIQNIGSDPQATYLYLDLEETKDPTLIVEEWVKAETNLASPIRTPAIICNTGEPISRSLTSQEVESIISTTSQKHTPDHAEARWLQPYCVGLCADIGCGAEKVKPEVLGIDKLAFGQKGKFGCMNGVASCSDVSADAADLWFIADGTLDAAVSRHCFEHIPCPSNTIREWLRVLKVGASLALVLPNDDWQDFLNMDKDHKFKCYPRTIADALCEVNKSKGSVRGELLELGTPVIPRWSFFAHIRRA